MKIDHSDESVILEGMINGSNARQTMFRCCVVLMIWSPYRGIFASPCPKGEVSGISDGAVGIEPNGHAESVKLPKTLQMRIRRSWVFHCCVA